MPPLTLGQNHLGDFFQRQITEPVYIATIGCTAHQQTAAFAYVIAQCLQLIGVERLCGDVDEIRFGAVPVLPIMVSIRSIVKDVLNNSNS